MDAVFALTSVLSGHLVSEHVEALREWLAKGGDEPVVAMPVDKTAAWALRCQNYCGDAAGADIEATASMTGIWFRHPTLSREWRLVVRWAELQDGSLCDFDECDEVATEERGAMSYCCQHAHEHDELLEGQKSR